MNANLIDKLTESTIYQDYEKAFTATTGDGPLHVAFCAEYDALGKYQINGGSDLVS